jgi:hypothetical protein
MSNQHIRLGHLPDQMQAPTPFIFQSSQTPPTPYTPLSVMGLPVPLHLNFLMRLMTLTKALAKARALPQARPTACGNQLVGLGA